MASNNNVIITLQANDQASVVIRNLNSQLDNGLTKSLGRATLGANLMTSAITTGLNSIGSLLTGIGGKLNDAMDIQQENISTAGTLMKLVGLNFKDATSFIDEFSNTMSKVAASLPGATSDYVNLGKGIMDNLVPAFKALDGSFDQEAYKEALNSISKDAGFLAATSKVDTSLASLGISKFLGGASTASLTKLKFFEANPATLAFIEQEAQKLGKSVEDLTARERVEVLKRALKVPDEVIKASTTSISGLIEGFKSTLLDPQTGVFGLMKDLSNDEGTQSAFTALNDGLIGILGEDGLLNTVGVSLRRLGISLGDPMVTLRNGILGFNKRVEEINNFLKSFNNSVIFNVNGEEKLRELFSKIFNFEGLGTKLAAFTNQGLDFLGNLDWGSVFGFVGTKLAELFNEIFRFIIKLDFVKIGDVILKALGGLFIGLGKFLSNLDWGALLLTLGKLIGYALLGVVAVATAMLVAPIVASIGTLGLAIAGLIAGVTAIVAANWENLTNSIKSFTGKISQFWDNVETHIENFFVEIIRRIPVIGEVVAKAEAKNPGLLKQSVGNSLNTFGSALKFGARLIPGFGALIPNSAEGRVDGLIAAAIREGKASPPGSGLVVANTSEAILNRQQQSALVNSLGRRGTGLSIGSINIHTQATDAKGIARDVMRAIVSEYNNFSQGYITAPVN
ncbi:hypothetical protein [Nostoc sp. UHCC 0870]|uniref:hypothetical protein n=1 Tax=Nostoc sp. UHCC 0870 TaxID=2914041 RepID=UPI001EE069EF|nr:hypothetical protein [Nostoc sp. UHCC 0870]UKO99361.1 hypothetical protein L6494_06510 [Nostoc sp. UHCC 0870]